MTNLSDNDYNNKIKTETTEDLSSLSNTSNNKTFSQTEETVQKIPLFAENFDITKKTEETQVNLTKRWIKTTKKIEIPVRYEELLINDKELDHYDEGEITEIFSKIKHKITDVFSHHDKNKDSHSKQEEQQQQQMGNEFDEYRYQQQQKELQQQKQQHSSDIDVRKYNEDEQQPSSDKDQNDSDKEQQQYPNKKLIPLSLYEKKENVDTSTNKQQQENIIPLWGEEITINKKMVKIGEIIIRKYQTNEKQKIDVDIKSEKLIVKYPDKRHEEIV